MDVVSMTVGIPALVGLAQATFKFAPTWTAVGTPDATVPADVHDPHASGHRGWCPIRSGRQQPVQERIRLCLLNWTTQAHHPVQRPAFGVLRGRIVSAWAGGIERVVSVGLSKQRAKFGNSGLGWRAADALPLILLNVVHHTRHRFGLGHDRTRGDWNGNRQDAGRQRGNCAA